MEGVTGPGRVTRFQGVDGRRNGKRLGRSAGGWVESAEAVGCEAVEALPRVGVDYAGAEWAGVRWRFRCRL